MSASNKWLSGMRVKLLFLILIPTVALGAVMYLGAKGLSDMSEDLEKANAVRIPLTRLSGDLDSTLNALPRWLWTAYVNAGNEAESKTSIKKVNASIESFEATKKE